MIGCFRPANSGTALERMLLIPKYRPVWCWSTPSATFQVGNSEMVVSTTLSPLRLRVSSTHERSGHEVTSATVFGEFISNRWNTKRECPALQKIFYGALCTRQMNF